MSGKALLFDLDGTLTDPLVGITRSIGYAMERLGRAAPAAESLRWCIGPPLKSAFRILLETEDEPSLDRAVALYRERYSDVGKFENVLIDGIPAVLETLQMRGCALFVATSKLKTYAGDIIDHFGLRPYFDVVYGSEADGTNSAKADLIAHILAHEAIQPVNCVMIGDRSHDMVGAHANGVGAVGVMWGFGDRDELDRSGALAIADTPADLDACVNRVLARSVHA